MIVTQEDLAEGRYVVVPWDWDDIAAFHRAVAEDTDAARQTNEPPPVWVAVLGANTEKSMLTCALFKGWLPSGGMLLESDGGPEGNARTEQRWARFWVADAKTGAVVARSPSHLPLNLSEFATPFPAPDRPSPWADLMPRKASDGK